jgi:hypothetical protein
MRLPQFFQTLFARPARTGGAGRRAQIVAAESFFQADGRFRFLVTLWCVRNVPCDGLDVLSPDGRVLGTCRLVEEGEDGRQRTHELADVSVERTMGHVFLRVRRRERGYDGQRFRVELPVA